VIEGKRITQLNWVILSGREHAASELICSYALILSVCLTESQSFIGVNYGQVADNLPPPAATANLLKSTTIGKIRLYGIDGAIIKALAGTGIGIVIGAANSEIPETHCCSSECRAQQSPRTMPHYRSSTHGQRP
jgi:hypothetical protein